ncbi:nitrite reductase small subunit NirD [Thalassotalea fusca]
MADTLMTINNAQTEQLQWLAICTLDALIENAGVCALLANQRQVALFYLPAHSPSLYAIDNYDPIGKANVLYRGIVGSTAIVNSDNGEQTHAAFVASPLFKQQFLLSSGQCLQQDDVQLRTYSVRVRDNMVQLLVSPQESAWTTQI